jgi:hypothetical protein
MCIPYLQHLPIPPSAKPPPLGRTCSALLFSGFVEEKNIKDNKKNLEFLLVRQGDSLCCFHAHVYYNPNWFISICQSSSLFPSPLPIVVWASLRLLHSFL